MRPNLCSILLCSPLIAFGWVLDRESCAGFETTVEMAFESAIDQANNAVDMLDLMLSPPESSEGVERAVQREAVEELRGYLFNKTVYDIAVGKHVLIAPQIRKVFAKVEPQIRNSALPGKPRDPEAFENLKDYSKLDPSEVVVFCDYARWKKNNDCKGHASGWACDKKFNVTVEMTNTWQRCETAFRGTVGIAFPQFKLDHGKAQAIQLCPGNLKYSKWYKYRTITDWYNKDASELKWDRWHRAASGIDYSPMDQTYMLDALILHEIMHVLEVPIPSSIIDFPLQSRSCLKCLFPSLAYGWARCLELAAENKARSQNNADSFALFAAGAKLINPGGNRKAYGPRRDGTLRPLKIKVP